MRRSDLIEKFFKICRNMPRTTENNATIAEALLMTAATVMASTAQLGPHPDAFAEIATAGRDAMEEKLIEIKGRLN